MTPEQGNGWYPRICPDGRIVCGLTEVFLGTPGAWTPLGNGGGGFLVAPDAVVLGDGDSTVAVTLSTGQRAVIGPGYNAKAFSDYDRWFGFRDAGKLMHEYEGTTLVKTWPPGLLVKAVTPDGSQVMHVDRPSELNKTLYLNDVVVAKDHPIDSCSMCDGAMLWLELGVVFGRRSGSTVTENWTVLPTEGPQLFDGPEGPWIASTLGGGAIADGMIIRPAGQKVGYRLYGLFYHPHVRYVNGQIIVASSREAGIFQLTTIDPASERIDLTVVPMPAVIAPNVPSVHLSGFWAADANSPGNFAIGSKTYLAPKHAVVFAEEQYLHLIPEDRLGGLLLYFAGNHDDAFVKAKIEQSIPIAAQRRVPICIYDDRRLGRFDLAKSVCGSAPWIWLPQWYVMPGEDVHAFAADAIARTKTYGGHPILPTPRAYTSVNGATPPVDVVPAETVTAALNALVTQGALKLPGLLGWAFFAWDRADGAKNRPALNPVIDAWMAVKTTAVNGRAFADSFSYEEISTVEPIKLSSSEAASVQLFASSFPLPKGSGFPSESAAEQWLDANYRYPPNGWTFRLAQYMRFKHGDKWGHKRRSKGAPHSAGSIAIRLTDGAEVEPGFFRADMHVFDLLISVASGQPQLDLGVDSLVVQDGQEWIRVDPVDHVAAVKPSNRPKIQLPPAGIDTFDLPPRVIVHKDQRWIDEVMIPGGFYGRTFTYANGSGGNRLWRDAATGLAQSRELMKIMVQKKARSLWIILCGTRPDGWSEQQSLDYVSQWNAMALENPEAVAAVAIFNENSHSIEQDYATNLSFLKAAESRIDSRFPVSYGAGHGGEGVSMAGGSWLGHHPDRDLQPDQAGATMAAAVAAGWDVVDEEGMGITEPHLVPGRQRVSDPNWFAGQLAAAKKYGVKSVVLHIDAGMTCNVDDLGPVQRAAIAIGLEANKVSGPPIVVPPPSQGHPILDVYLPGKTHDAMSDAGYVLFVSRRKEIEALAAAWYLKDTGNKAADSDIVMMVYIVGVAERARWETLRKAWKAKYPKGEPA